MTTDLTLETKRETKPKKKRIMVAGIGNTFLKDDGFGSVVIKNIRSTGSERFKNIEINDVGIGGLKLAYDLMKGYDGLILIDSTSRNEQPGTLYIIEVDDKDVNADIEQGGPIDPHGADPATVLRFIKALNAWPGKVIIVGCEPDVIDEFQLGLSDRVKAAAEKAVELVEGVIDSMTKN